MEEKVNKEFCEEHGKMIDERFARDKNDLKKHDEAIDKITQLTAEISALVKQHEDVIKRHNNEIAELKNKPSLWFDRIINGVVSALVAAAMAYFLSR